MKNYKRKLVSFCVWGPSKLYNYGLYENALKMPEVYPGWIMHVIYTPTADQKVMQEIAKFPWVEMELIDVPNHTKNTMLRFLPAMSPKNDVIVSRDADSRLLKRDYMAVMDWLNNSNKKAHMMRDHPFNKSPIMAGLWGVRDQILAKPEIVMKFAEYFRNPEFTKWSMDQRYLEKYIYPLLKNTSRIHAAFNRFEKWSSPFPPGCPPRNKGFCGQTFHSAPNAVKKFNDQTARYGKKRYI